MFFFRSLTKNTGPVILPWLLHTYKMLYHMYKNGDVYNTARSNYWINFMKVGVYWKSFTENYELFTDNVIFSLKAPLSKLLKNFHEVVHWNYSRGGRLDEKKFGSRKCWKLSINWRYYQVLHIVKPQYAIFYERM